MKFEHEARRIVGAIDDMTGDAISNNTCDAVYETYVLGVSNLLQEIIESRERKAWEVGHRRSSGDGQCYSDFEEYFASPEYLSEEIAKDGN